MIYREGDQFTRFLDWTWTVIDLDSSLKSRGSQLFLVHGNPTEVIPELLEKEALMRNGEIATQESLQGLGKEGKPLNVEDDGTCTNPPLVDIGPE
ncbi:hypothetical protein Mp_3g24190 [Marchantia polymorpha subsp. ruderalis]|uniref:Uncharacterized protein n=1 Tax=Marchantia polymorpha subsp. ruderalis TaxID=1480154 RepID=A0AAF6B490_MARPO|nr:hypothetical protein Mp_3g24190 [Marchantia polymorpha subsp. ruderalis]